MFKPEIIELTSEYIKAVQKFIGTVLYDEFGFEQNGQLDYDIDNLEESYAPPDGIFYIVLDEDRVIGTAALRRLTDDSAEVKRMFISQEFRRQGIGSTLLEKLLKFAEEADYIKLFLDTASDHTDAIALYSKFGFKKTRRYNDNFRADVFMVKHINK